MGGAPARTCAEPRTGADAFQPALRFGFQARLTAGVIIMKCWGRTKKFKRCGNDVHFAFCHHHRWQPIVAIISTLSFVGVLAGLYQDLIRPAFNYFNGTSLEQPQTHTPKPQNVSTELKTLRDLFLSDFDKTSMRGEYHLTKNTKVVYTVEYIIWYDFDTKTKYLSVFLPKSDYTFSASMFLVKKYDNILNGNIRSLMKAMTHQAPGEQAETYDELSFSGRIYIYHETYMLPARIQSLIKEYEKANLSPKFRGRDYLIMKNSPLYEK